MVKLGTPLFYPSQFRPVKDKKTAGSNPSGVHKKVCKVDASPGFSRLFQVFHSYFHKVFHRH